VDTPEEMASFQFAHLLLPRLAFSDPAAPCRGLVNGSDALEKLWASAHGGAAAPSVRYFPLEPGSIHPGITRAWFLCEWEPDRGHANWGALPSADPGPFLQRVQALLYTSAA
jgi:hypothetical protein